MFVYCIISNCGLYCLCENKRIGSRRVYDFVFGSISAEIKLNLFSKVKMSFFRDLRVFSHAKYNIFRTRRMCLSSK